MSTTTLTPAALARGGAGAGRPWNRRRRAPARSPTSGRSMACDTSTFSSRPRPHRSQYAVACSARRVAPERHSCTSLRSHPKVSRGWQRWRLDSPPRVLSNVLGAHSASERRSTSHDEPQSKEISPAASDVASAGAQPPAGMNATWLGIPTSYRSFATVLSTGAVEDRSRGSLLYDLNAGLGPLPPRTAQPRTA